MDNNEERCKFMTSSAHHPNAKSKNSFRHSPTSGQVRWAVSLYAPNALNWDVLAAACVALTCALGEAMGAAADAWWRWCPTLGCCGCSWANPRGVTMGTGCYGNHGRIQSLQWETRLSSPSPQQKEIVCECTVTGGRLGLFVLGAQKWTRNPQLSVRHTEIQMIWKRLKWSFEVSLIVSISFKLSASCRKDFLLPRGPWRC